MSKLKEITEELLLLKKQIGVFVNEAKGSTDPNSMLTRIKGFLIKNYPIQLTKQQIFSLEYQLLQTQATIETIIRDCQEEPLDLDLVETLFRRYNNTYFPIRSHFTNQLSLLLDKISEIKICMKAIRDLKDKNKEDEKSFVRIIQQDINIIYKITSQFEQLNAQLDKLTAQTVIPLTFCRAMSKDEYTRLVEQKRLTGSQNRTSDDSIAVFAIRNQKDEKYIRNLTDKARKDIFKQIGVVNATEIVKFKTRTPPINAQPVIQKIGIAAYFLAYGTPVSDIEKL